MVSTYKDARRSRDVKPADATSHEGGAVYKISPFAQLRRFLVIGTVAGTFYETPKKITRENQKVIHECLKADPDKTLGIIAEVAHGNVAPSNEPVLFALAVVPDFDFGTMEKNKHYHQRAYDIAVEICKTWTHVSHFLLYRSPAGIAGRGQRRFIRNWFGKHSDENLIYQAIKYASRDEWAQRDALILARPKPFRPVQNAVYRYLVKGELPTFDEIADQPELESMFRIINVRDIHAGMYKTGDIAKLIVNHRLPRESIPTELLNDPVIWEALLQDMPFTAMIRNLNKMTAIGLLTDKSDATKRVLSVLADEYKIKGSRVHPFTLVTALKQYEKGFGDRGKQTWSPIKKIVNALDEAVYLAFGNVVATGKATLLGLDVSSSMGAAAGSTGMSCREVEAIMALVTMTVEPKHTLIGYTDKVHVDLGKKIRPSMRLDEVVRVLQSYPAGYTHCRAPIAWASTQDNPFDVIVNYTDGETADRGNTVATTLQKYRESIGRPVRHIAVAAAANSISINDPTDQLSLDIAGFGADVPTVITEFASGRI